MGVVELLPVEDGVEETRLEDSVVCIAFSGSGTSMAVVLHEVAQEQ